MAYDPFLDARAQIDDALGLRGQRTPQPPARMAPPTGALPAGQPMQQPMQQPGLAQLGARYGVAPPGPKAFKKGGAVWTRKEGQNPEGGLNAAGRASLKAQGHDIKPPVSAKQAKKSPKAAARRSSFCARMGGMEGPMKDDKGRPTRKALALRKWDC